MLQATLRDYWTNGSILFHIVPYCSILFQMVPYGSKWFQMVPYCSKWFQVVPGGFRWFQVVPYGFRWFQDSSIWFHGTTCPEGMCRRPACRSGRHPFGSCGKTTWNILYQLLSTDYLPYPARFIRRSLPDNRIIP